MPGWHDGAVMLVVEGRRAEVDQANVVVDQSALVTTLWRVVLNLAGRVDEKNVLGFQIGVRDVIVVENWTKQSRNCCEITFRDVNCSTAP